MKVFNPYSSGIWSKKNLDLSKTKYQEFKNLVNSIDYCVKVSDLQNIFKQNIKHRNKNMNILHSKSIKRYLEEKSGVTFPNHQYSFITLNKVGSRYATVTGIKVSNIKTGTSFSHNCNIESLDSNQLERQLKRIRIKTILRKAKMI